MRVMAAGKFELVKCSDTTLPGMSLKIAIKTFLLL